MGYFKAGSERVLWAAAALVEREHGQNGDRVISDIIDDLMRDDDIKGVELWAKVAERYERLSGVSVRIN